MTIPLLPEEVRAKAAALAGQLRWSPGVAISFICHMLQELNEPEILRLVLMGWKNQAGMWADGFTEPVSPARAAQPTPGPWAILGANVFRVIAPAAPHQNEPEGKCPAFPYAIVCETDPKSVGGEQAAANCRAISQLPALRNLFAEYVQAGNDPSADLKGRIGEVFRAMGL